MYIRTFCGLNFDDLATRLPLFVITIDSGKILFTKLFCYKFIIIIAFKVSPFMEASYVYYIRMHVYTCVHTIILYSRKHWHIDAIAKFFSEIYEIFHFCISFS